MTLTWHKKHKIYIAAIMHYGLGSHDPQEVVFYSKIKKEMKESTAACFDFFGSSLMIFMR